MQLQHGGSNMKILMVNKFLFLNGGSETYVYNLGKYLSAMGHEVQYFGMEHENNILKNNLDLYTDKMDFHTASAVRKLQYSLKTIYSREAKMKIRRILQDFKPDVVHLNNFNYQLTPSIIVEIENWKKAYQRNCKIVYTAHDYQLVCPNHMLRNPITNTNCTKCLEGNFVHCMKDKCIHGSKMKSINGMLEAFFWKKYKIYDKIDTIICCSKFMKSVLDQNPIFKNKTIVLQNFVKPINNLSAEKKDYVLYFGRYSEEKGIKNLLKVCKKLPNIPFIFAGTGDLENDMKGIPNVKNVGFKKGDELVNLIKQARFSVYPSDWYENCPFSVIESQMYGTPVLGADIGGIPELIQNGKTGELFESGNIIDLKTKIEMLWNEKKLTNQYSQNCQENTFVSIENYYKKLMKIYQL